MVTEEVRVGEGVGVEVVGSGSGSGSGRRREVGQNLLLPIFVSRVSLMVE